MVRRAVVAAGAAPARLRKAPAPLPTVETETDCHCTVLWHCVAGIDVQTPDLEDLVDHYGCHFANVWSCSVRVMRLNRRRWRPRVHADTDTIELSFDLKGGHLDAAMDSKIVEALSRGDSTVQPFTAPAVHAGKASYTVGQFRAQSAAPSHILEWYDAWTGFNASRRDALGTQAKQSTC